jgi:hypothetical protein
VSCRLSVTPIYHQYHGGSLICCGKC